MVLHAVSGIARPIASCCVVFAAITAALASADARAQLLGTIQFGTIQEPLRSGGNFPHIADITGASISLGFRDGSSSSLVGCIGCIPFLPVGSFGGRNFDFTRANSPTFDTFVSHLTNQLDEELATEFTLYGSFAGAGSGSNIGTRNESSWFGHLFGEGQAVELVRLHFDLYELKGVDLFQPPGSQETFAFRWEIYGPVVPIPEPSTAWMLLAGLAMLGSTLRRATLA